MFRSHFMIFLTLAFLSFPLAIAQDSEEFDEPLSKKQAEKTVKSAEDALKDAKRAQSRDDTPRMGRELERYSSHMNNLERGLHDGSVLHDEHEDVALIVAEATSKHMSTLEELRGKVPPQGQEGIDRAFEVSQRGHDTALENLSRNDEPLSKKQAKKTVKLAEDALKDAKRAQSRDDTPRMGRELERYSSHMNKLESGLHDGNVLHDEHEDVAQIVAEATSKQMSTLEELRAKVSDQGKAGIDRAYAVSQQGHDTALENLSRNDEPLSKKQAKKTVKLAEDALKDAKRAQSRDDTPRMGRELERYSSHMNKLESGLHDGNVLHDEHEDVAGVVAEATYKHTSTLEELYNNDKVPEQGKEGIKHALEVSQRGYDTALENLSKDRRDEVTQRHERQHRPSSTGQSSGSDGSLRGSPPGAGPGTVGGPGRGGSPGGGGSQGGNRGRR